jgi:hypothetical protein
VFNIKAAMAVGMPKLAKAREWPKASGLRALAAVLSPGSSTGGGKATVRPRESEN